MRAVPPIFPTLALIALYCAGSVFATEEVDPDTSNRTWAICDARYKLTNEGLPSTTMPDIKLFSMPDGEYIPDASYTRRDQEARNRLFNTLPFGG